MRYGFNTDQALKENGATLLRSVMSKNMMQFIPAVIGETVVLKEQLSHVRKVYTGFTPDGGEKYKITGKLYTKEHGINHQDDQAMALLLNIYWLHIYARKHKMIREYPAYIVTQDDNVVFQPYNYPVEAAAKRSRQGSAYAF